MFFLIMMFIALIVSAVEMVGLIMLGFLLEYHRKVYSLVVLAFLTTGSLFLWLYAMSLGFDFPWSQWRSHSEFAGRVFVAGVVVGSLISISTKLWNLSTLNQFLRQSISAIFLTASWIIISVTHLFTIAFAMRLSLR